MPDKPAATIQEIETQSPEETFHFGNQLAQSLPKPCNILLFGALGMGKTVLAKGIVCGLGVEDPDDVVSPSFTLIQEYRIGDRVIQHIDLYRLDRAQDIVALGIEELLDNEQTYVIVEWAEKLPFAQIPNTISIHLRDLEDNRRAIRVERK